MNDKKMIIQKVKGRAMLYWVGKKPIDSVESYPAQLVETVGDVNALETPNYDTLENDWSNLLFHGDNKEILSTLLTNGFRGKVDLIYIDPPFDSKADYVRKVELRGAANGKLDGEAQTTIEQVQYEDIWANDNYLQFMYERLILLRELLSDQGTLYLHCDWHKGHQLKILLDEVFGLDKFISEVIWKRSDSHNDAKTFSAVDDRILVYSKTDKFIFNTQYNSLSKDVIDAWYNNTDESGRRYKLQDTTAPGGRGPVYNWNGVTKAWRYTREKMENLKKQGLLYHTASGYPKKIVYLDESKGVPLNTIWSDLRPVNRTSGERTDYPTQKPEHLLERIISISSNAGSLVLDSFIGSGTTAAAAQKLDRRWIGADINKGAIQTTMKRLQSEQLKVLHYRVNNYDFQQMSALRAIIVEKYGIEESKTDSYFDGTVGQRLVKIAELNKPVTKLDVQGIIDELKNRLDEDRDILLIGSGMELGVDALLKERQQLAGSVNKIEIKDIQTDGVIVAEPAEADVTIDKKDNKVAIKINSYISPTIIKRLDLDRSIFGEHIKDFRAQIDTVMIDTDYDGKTFNVVHSDVPAKKSDFVADKYELSLPKTSKKVAIKITDMLGEETIVVG